MATVIGEGHVAIPDSVSLQANVTVTFELFQPAALAAGEMLTEIVGGVLSMLIVTHAGAVFPAASSTWTQTTWLAPSVLTA